MNWPKDGPTSAATDNPDVAEIRMPLIEEELTATTRPAHPGPVRIAKLTTSDDSGLEVPVTDASIRVERRVVERRTETDRVQPFEQIIIELPINDAADVQNDAPAMEEIVIRIQTTRRVERITSTVRREAVFIGEAAAADAGFARSPTTTRSSDQGPAPTP